MKFTGSPLPFAIQENWVSLMNEQQSGFFFFLRTAQKFEFYHKQDWLATLIENNENERIQIASPIQEESLEFL